MLYYHLKHTSYNCTENDLHKCCCSGIYRPRVLAKRMPTMRGEKDRCLKKGRVLKAMADPTRRVMRCMPGRNGNWAENFV